MMQGIGRETAGLEGLQEQVVQDLNRMMHDFAGLARQLHEKLEMLPPSDNVLPFPRPDNSYVMQYRDEAGCSRFAVVRGVTGETAESILLTTSQGPLKVLKAAIDDWVPVADRADDPYPAGWWKRD